jgi:hypothetical protein
MDLAKIKSGELFDFNQFSARVTLTGAKSNHILKVLKDLKAYY